MSVLFIRSFTPDYDGKIQKYFKSLDCNKIEWTLLGWERSGEGYSGAFNNGATYYNRIASLGGGYKNILNIIFWNFYIFKYLIHNRKSIKLIHAIDFDSVFPAFIFSFLFQKKIVFDVYDKYTSMRNFPKIIKKTIDKIENLIILKSNLSILADESRYKQQGVNKSNNIFILENVPIFQKNIKYEKLINSSETIQLGYFGVLEKGNRGLEDISNSVIKLDGYILHIAGYGELEKYFEDLSSKYPDKIRFYGPMKSSEGLNLMFNVDILVGFYYRNIENHLYAAPNKYYEHLMLGKPLLTTKGTPPGIKVEHNQTGWAIEEGEDAIVKTLSMIKEQGLEDDSLKIKAIWNSNYSSYFEDFYVRKYAEKVKNMISSEI